MPYIRRIPTANQGGEHKTNLVIRKNCFSPGFSYKYEKMAFITNGHGSTLHISLVMGRCMRGFTIHAYEHCCTRPDAMKRVAQGSHRSSGHDYDDMPTEVTYNLTLAERELIQIGLIVRVMRGEKHEADLLCDPQVGSGPPESRRFFFAPELVLQPRA